MRGTMAPGTPGTPSDDDLALLSRGGDLAAFDTLARRLQGRLFSYALRIVGDSHAAEDLTQETLLRTFTSLPRFDPAQRFAPWVFGIAAHVCRDWLRRRRRRPERVQEVDAHAATAPPAWQEAASGEQRERVLRAVRRLPLKYREVIVLHYLEDLPYEQVAQSLGIRAAAARRRALRARHMLARYLGDAGEQGGTTR